MIGFLPKTKATVLSLLTLGACAQGGGTNQAELKSNFNTLLGTGRGVNFARTSADQSGLNLALAAVPGAVVSVEVDEQSQRPSWVLYNTAITDGVPVADLTEAALQFLKDNEGFLATGVDQLTPEGQPVRLAPRLLAVNFSRIVNGFQLRDAYIEVVYAEDATGLFHIREIVNRSHGDFEIKNRNAQETSPDVLQELTGLEALEVVDFRRVIFTKRLVTGTLEYVLASEFEVIIGKNPPIYTVTIEDGSEIILESFSSHLNVTALNAKVFEKGYLDGKTIDVPLPFARLQYDDTGQQLTSADGTFTFEAPKAVTVHLTSPRGSVFNNMTPTPTSLAASLSTQSFAIQGANPEEMRALNSYSSIHRINRFARQFLKDSDAPILGQNVGVHYSYLSPNVADPKSCNAYFDSSPQGFGLYFLQGSAATDATICPNMAEINNVMYHEWGHALDFSTGRTKNLVSDGAFSEGIGDIVAGFYEQSAVIGQGFLLNNPAGIRTMENAKVYPTSIATPPEVHRDGEIIGGTFWELRKELITRHGAVKGQYLASWLFMRHLLDTDTYLDSYQSVLRLADDDLNPATKAPDHCLINKVFAKRGLATAENCEDPPLNIVVPTDPDLAIAVKTQTAAGAMLMVASTNAESIVACLGERYSCLTVDAKNPLYKPSDILFTFEGESDGKKFFVANSPVPLTELGAITITKKDLAGKATGARSFRMALK